MGIVIKAVQDDEIVLDSLAHPFVNPTFQAALTDSLSRWMDKLGIKAVKSTQRYTYVVRSFL